MAYIASLRDIGPMRMNSLEQIIDDFAFLDDWEDRYRYVIELGKALPDLAEDKKHALKTRCRAAPARSGWSPIRDGGGRSAS